MSHGDSSQCGTRLGKSQKVRPTANILKDVGLEARRWTLVNKIREWERKHPEEAKEHKRKTTERMERYAREIRTLCSVEGCGRHALYLGIKKKYGKVFCDRHKQEALG